MRLILHATPKDDDSPEADARTRPAGLYISQVARILGVSPSALRMWEAQGLSAPERTSSGYRVYSMDEVERLRRVRDLIQRDGLNPAGVRRMLDSDRAPRAAEREKAPEEHVGPRVQRARLRRGVSLRALASATGLSASSVSAIERGVSAPSVGTLQRLAAALDTTVPKLLGTRRPSPRLVVRPSDRVALDMETPGVRFENLYAVDTALQSILITVEPGAGTDESYSHEGEEFLYVTAGRLELTLDELHTYELEAGDAMTFASTRPHRWRNPGDVTTEIVWLNSPPTF
jgi:DNA-binding transcriptional MerR regulator/quercetin dioxygenase-like cupin family protein